MKSLLTLFILAWFGRGSVTECLKQQVISHLTKQVDTGETSEKKDIQGRMLSGSLFNLIPKPLKNIFFAQTKAIDPTNFVFEKILHQIPLSGTKASEALHLLCEPAIMEIVLERKKATFLCVNLLKSRDEKYPSLDYLENYHESAHAKLASMLKEAVKPLLGNLNSLFTERNIFFKNANEEAKGEIKVENEVRAEAQELVTNFQRNFDHAFEKLQLELGNITHKRFISATNMMFEEKETKARTNWLLGALRSEDIADWPTKLKTVVGSRTLSLEDMPGEGVYPFLPDLIATKGTSNEFLLRFKLRSLCQKSLDKLYKDFAYKTCNLVLISLSRDKQINEELEFFRESESFINMLKDLFLASINRNINELAELPSRVLSEMKQTLTSIRPDLENAFSSDFSKETATFFYDIGKEGKTASVRNFLRENKIIAQLKNQLKEYFYSSQKVQLFLTEKLESLYNLSGQGNNLPLTELRTKLTEACESMFNNHQKDICISVLLKLDLEGLTQQRHGNLLASVLANHFAKLTEKIDFKSSDQNTLEEFFGEKMQEFVSKFLNGFLENPTHFTDFEHKKAKMLYIAAYRLSQLADNNFEEDALSFFHKKTKENPEPFVKNAISSQAFQNQLNDIIAEGLKEINIAPKRIFETEEKLLGEISNRSINVDVQNVVLNFDQLEQSLKDSLQICAPKDVHLDAHLETCSKNFGKPCRVSNPFLLETVCPKGSQPGPDSICRLFCPEGFVAEDSLYCAKPEVTLLDLETYACPPHHVLETVLCIPQCPLGWIDDGRTCERPVTDNIQLHFMA